MKYTFGTVGSYILIFFAATGVYHWLVYLFG